MTKSEICARIQEIGIIPAVWVSSSDDASFAADSLAGAGIPILEVSVETVDTIDLIAHLVRSHQGMIVGAGTVLDTETAKRAFDAGAGFLTAPVFNYSIAEFAADRDIALIPGALTPTEVHTAWRLGADFVKVFPCSQVGGDKYIKALKKALPQVPLVASGGDSTYGNRVHFSRSRCPGGRVGLDTAGCHRATASGANPGTRTSLLWVR